MVKSMLAKQYKCSNTTVQNFDQQKKSGGRALLWALYPQVALHMD